MSTSSRLSLRDGGLERGGTPLLSGIRFDVAPGEVIVLEGPNGTGKTSLLLMLAGLHPLAAGEARLDGRALGKLSVHARAQLGIRLVRDVGLLFPKLSVAENFRLAGGPAHAGSRPDLAAVGVADRLWTQPAATLSGGEARILAILAALEARPALLLIDEFVEGLQRRAAERLTLRIRALAEADGMSALLVSQNARFAQEHGLRSVSLAEFQA